MGVFLWLSDLHLDPYYGTENAASHHAKSGCGHATLLEHPYGRVGCDAPKSLVASALRDAASAAADGSGVDFVLIVGDFARHGVDRLGAADGTADPVEIAGSIFSYCVDTIRSNFPDVPIIPVIGNNDVVPDYYLDTLVGDGNITGSIISNLATSGLGDALSAEEAATFAHGGYFSRVVGTDGSGPSPTSVLFLSLNTVLYSVRHEPDGGGDGNPNDGADGDGDDDPLGQFAWLKSQLARAAANRTWDHAPSGPPTEIVAVYIAGHIPPSVGSYRHTQLWRTRYLERYSKILREYSGGEYAPDAFDGSKRSNAAGDGSAPPPPILGHFFGHLHTEEFRLIDFGPLGNGSDEQSPSSLVVPLLVASSVTPIYGANPSYRIVRTDQDTGAPLDYTTRYLDLAVSNARGEPRWIALPGFVGEYGVPDLSPDSFGALRDGLGGELALLRSTCGPSGGAAATPLWDAFLGRRDLYSPYRDDGDDPSDGTGTGVLVDWMCTLRSSTRKDYEGCLSDPGGFGIATAADGTADCLRFSASGGLLVFVGVAAAAGVVLACVWAARKNVGGLSSLLSGVAARMRIGEAATREEKTEVFPRGGATGEMA